MIRNFTTALFVALGLVYSCAANAQGAGRTIEVHAHRFAFTPDEITIHKGETVHLKLISDDVPHSLLIKDLNINQTITKGHPADVTLSPKKAGDFPGNAGGFAERVTERWDSPFM